MNASRLAGISIALAVLASSRAGAGTGFERDAWPPSALALARPASGAFAVPLLAGGERPELVLAQRTIEREWTTHEDPNAAKAIPGWRSEPAALGLSAAVPGAGQLFIGERSGFLFALAEAAGWVGYFMWRHDANDLRDQSETVAGAPDDPQSGWSFDRWAAVSQGDPSELRALYAADREAFYDLIGRDSRYQAGWVDGGTQQRFGDLRDRSNHQLRRSKFAGGALWVNHLVAAADALRAARIQNLPLRRNLDLKASGGWNGGQPALRLAVESHF